MTSNSDEIAQGERFEFGNNWRNFLSVLDDKRIELAVQSLQKALGRDSLASVRMLDAGCGSGLFSLAARRLGATVHSFDYDPQSVACARELRQRYFPNDPDWQIEAGSVLDEAYLGGLGQFDIVYSWGVLHHTGSMYRAFGNVLQCVAENGRLFISIYNDQGGESRRWRAIKKFYCGLPSMLRLPFAAAVMAPKEIISFVGCLLTLRPGRYWERWHSYGRQRGMSRWHDHVDWLGGYPFEVARPEEVIHFFQNHQLRLTHLKTVGGGLGCNEFIFQSEPASAAMTSDRRGRVAA
jgi:2-polyprenyl-6-hydroxyphenyl methylase/3-demethylubiquinone-9 3-methyltransferase